jgi:hypothetical protein
MARYFPTVTVLDLRGNAIRHVPSGIAGALVDAGNAHPVPTRGRVSSVQLIRSASTHAERIGPPTNTVAMGVRFYRWSQLSSGTRVYEHHPRCLY